MQSPAEPAADPDPSGADAERIYALSRPHPRLLTLFLLRSVLSGPFFPFVFFYNWRVYRTLRYRFTGEGVAMSLGRLWRRESYLTYARIQDIHLSRSLFQRWLGLGTIHIQTASGTSKPELSIDGLLEYELVRDFLYGRMRGARAEPGTDTGPPPDHSEDDLVPLLRDIRDELRGIRRTLEARGGR